MFYLKRVAVQQGLEEIRLGLERKGYEVVDYMYGGHIDAIVYTDIYSGLDSVNNSVDGNIYGAILINANNKTIDEIGHIIETRRYERLFTK
nr:YkuS family protein [Alkaliphilus sp. B6464]